MAEQRKRAVGPGEDAGRTAPLPDLTDIDLRTLRAMDDPGLSAAVEQVLCGATEFREVWYGDGEGGDNPGKPGKRTFSVGLAEVGQAEENRG
ncbi:hypothetical protein QQY66_32840 [Streptomyces sp. DG2A-72]|uniref:hypothetical protein n=1 Tax=Streptomyces sp. DG2A-72 TaxID=3051386 RepID=UPI00265C288B|nr:hypothetical protein [Streptomyces sp. DG2A-72]MDO0936258.1 hypothetical protein [Streptomyces sp. DG2A-72]